MSPSAQLVAIRREVKRLIETPPTSAWKRNCSPALAEAAASTSCAYPSSTPSNCRRARRYFAEIIFPVLTPLAFDPGRPFPHISNLSLNLAVLIRDAGGDERFARVKVPDSLPALVPLHSPAQTASKRSRTRRKESYVWLEEVMAANLDALFPGMEIVEAHPFHVTRDADIAIKELEAEDLLETIEEGVRQRKFGSVVRLQVNQEMPHAHPADPDDQPGGGATARYTASKGLLGLSRLIARGADRPARPEVHAFPSGHPAGAAARPPRKRIIFTHHPAAAIFCCTTRSNRSSRWSIFCGSAARDPDVLAIKMVLYRVGRNSPVVEALLEAIEEGKQVAVLMELKARFDEESNIEWARRWSGPGVHVVYGLLGLKIHCKAAMVLRREGDGIQPYLHLATGNYNVVTAHLYTDLGLFTGQSRRLGRRHHRPVQFPDRLFGEAGLPQAAGGAGQSAASASRRWSNARSSSTQARARATWSSR